MAQDDGAQRVVAIAGADEAVRAAYARANATYFTGRLADMRKSAVFAVAVSASIRPDLNP